METSGISPLAEQNFYRHSVSSFFIVVFFFLCFTDFWRHIFKGLMTILGCPLVDQSVSGLHFIDDSDVVR
jgi:hypothetical protein